MRDPAINFCLEEKRVFPEKYVGTATLSVSGKLINQRNVYLKIKSPDACIKSREFFSKLLHGSVKYFRARAFYDYRFRYLPLTVYGNPEYSSAFNSSSSGLIRIRMKLSCSGKKCSVGFLIVL